MAKAKRKMKEDLPLVDAIIEVIDSRCPNSSRNPEIDILAKDKARIMLFNKADLADPVRTKSFMESFQKQGFYTMEMDARSRSSVKGVSKLVMESCAELLERKKQKGILSQSIKAMVLGIPNVGKSTFINAYVGKATAKTGNKPGVTRGNQWIRFQQSIELLDTPGILWPKFEDPAIGEKIAFLGSVNEMIVDKTELAVTLLAFLETNGKLEGAKERYQLKGTETAAEMLTEIARLRGCLMAGGEPDTEKAAGIVINEFRSGALGRISLEAPEGEAHGTQNTEG